MEETAFDVIYFFDIIQVTSDSSLSDYTIKSGALNTDTMVNMFSRRYFSDYRHFSCLSFCRIVNEDEVQYCTRTFTKTLRRKFDDTSGERDGPHHQLALSQWQQQG